MENFILKIKMEKTKFSLEYERPFQRFNYVGNL